MYQLSLWIALLILIIVAIIEIWKPQILNEGFTNLISVGDTAFWAKWLPRRGDVGLNPTEEQPGYIRDIRYFAGYTDVQRLGVNHDFCRMVQAEGPGNPVTSGHTLRPACQRCSRVGNWFWSLWNEGSPAPK